MYSYLGTLDWGWLICNTILRVFFLHPVRFIMNEPFIDAAGPSLGAVSVFTKTMEKDGTTSMKPIWRLYNHQGPDWTYAQALISEPSDAVSGK